MKSTGIVRRTDNLGRLVIPKEIRKNFGIDAHHDIEIYVEGQTIIVCKVQNKCVFCDVDEGLQAFSGKLVCSACSANIRQTPDILQRIVHDVGNNIPIQK